MSKHFIVLAALIAEAQAAADPDACSDMDARPSPRESPAPQREQFKDPHRLSWHESEERFTNRWRKREALEAINRGRGLCTLSRFHSARQGIKLRCNMFRGVFAFEHEQHLNDLSRTLPNRIRLYQNRDSSRAVKHEVYARVVYNEVNENFEHREYEIIFRGVNLVSDEKRLKDYHNTRCRANPFNHHDPNGALLPSCSGATYAMREVDETALNNMNDLLEQIRDQKAAPAPFTYIYVCRPGDMYGNLHCQETGRVWRLAGGFTVSGL